ncbi:SDR family NAD(P)-dependent oxidoreductase [Sphingomonas sp.]|uniref:SDR family NAD(P)-dependent oxidoreductase n=1 Tax=Sphingomonas sp. TaxID=28214 RepID=UPI0025F9EE96|nr:SDR family NAD(P)-dependent oxidoreductase [Sphingomonas sp.]
MPLSDFAGRNAFITGGASGIGLATAHALARAGANVALADIEPEPLEVARAAVAAHGGKTIAIPLDVSDAVAVATARDRFLAELGTPHVLINNAGVSLRPTLLGDVGPGKWDWLLGVNLLGVVNGVTAFVPEMLRRGEGGHIVNTASIVAMQVHPFLHNIPYRMSKAGVVNLSECLDLEYGLAEAGIGVSVFCPALVSTGIINSSFRRPERFGGSFSNDASAKVDSFTDVGAAATPDFTAALLLDAIKTDTFFVFTHPECADWIGERDAKIRAGFAQLDRVAETYASPS